MGRFAKLVVGLDSRGYFVYRCRDADGVLLYIGCTGNVANRLGQHAAASAWWSRVEAVDIVTFRDHRAAIDAERAAILREQPSFNKQVIRPRVTRLEPHLTSEVYTGPLGPPLTPEEREFLMSDG